MPHSSPAAIVQAQVEAFNARDLEAFCATYADDAVVIGVRDHPISGKEAVRSFYETRFNDPHLHCEIDVSMTLGDRWYVARELITTTEGTAETVATFDVRDGRIIRASMLKA